MPAPAPTRNSAACRQLTAASRYHAARAMTTAVIAAGGGTRVRDSMIETGGLSARVFIVPLECPWCASGLERGADRNPERARTAILADEPRGRKSRVRDCDRYVV